MPINSIAKGKNGERQVVKALNPILDELCRAAGCASWRLDRNLSQAAKGGEDLVGVPGIAIEIKWHADCKGKLGMWWEQTARQAGATKLPVLIYRGNGIKWRVRLWTLITIDPDTKRRLKVVSDISWDDFLLWFRKWAEVQIKKSLPPEPIPGASGLFD